MEAYELYDILSRIPSPNSDEKTNHSHRILASKLPPYYKKYIHIVYGSGWGEVKLSQLGLKFCAIYKTLSTDDRVRDVEELELIHPSWF